MTLRTFALATFLSATAAGCGHTTMRGTVVMKIDPVQAHVCLAENDVAVSDRVQLYRKVCRSVPKQPSLCRNETLATGTVDKLLNNHYAVVTFPVGTAFTEGDKVAKVR